jgi:hypothetical protein
MLRRFLDYLGVIPPQNTPPYYQTSGAPPGNAYKIGPPKPLTFPHAYPPQNVEHVQDSRIKVEG